MGWQTAWAEAGVARRFVDRLGRLSVRDRRPALAPILDRDPYLSAWTNVEAALANAPETDRARLRDLFGELDAELEGMEMLPSFREAARRALRAIVARRWLLTSESLTFLYEPFETMIPLTSLAE